MKYVCTLLTLGALAVGGCGQHSAPGAVAGSSTPTPSSSASAASSNIRDVPSSAPAASPTTAATPSAIAYQYDAVAGKKLYFVTCSVCHQANGTGMAGVFPPLKNNPVVTDNDATRQIMTVLHGVSGRLTVLGAKYNGTMPAFGNKLSDADIANIINYERSSWGNHSRHTTASQVAAVRRSSKS